MKGSYHYEESFTPMQKLQLDNKRLERDRQKLTRENESLKEKNRILRLEILSMKSTNQKVNDKFSKSMTKIESMHSAFAEMAQKTRNMEWEKNSIDMKRRELIRKKIDDDKQTQRLESAVNSLSIKCIQHKTSDQITVNKMTEYERLIEKQSRQIMKLKSENERLKEQFVRANNNLSTTATELKRKEKYSAMTQRELNQQIQNQEDKLNKTYSQIKQIEKQKEEVEEKVVKQTKKAENLEISNKNMILNIHQVNDLLQKEKENRKEKEMEIIKLKKEVDRLNGIIQQNGLQIDAFQKRLDALQSVAYKKAQQREKDKATPRFEKLRQKYVSLEESNKVLNEEITFLQNNNKLLKSQLNSQSANRVNQLMFQNEAIRNENAKLRKQLEESDLLKKIDEMQEKIENLENNLESKNHEE
ncbi:hypothetical protein TRFO_25263 [Tritrichomonas foetus]|uniref:Uncharacterized protein n=1 Tax=Tritrichomonas foetus TaxID=1144522 RepID=A0A1J4K5B8_9EUKA|nr:hypothetical protein TRFO_25263 [Tritrichomonas foetus]|eukprot:OHT06649.1 hypothetical protein TRFO_25263 [Tritrichomonas foetus]